MFKFARNVIKICKYCLKLFYIEFTSYFQMYNVKRFWKPSFLVHLVVIQNWCISRVVIFTELFCRVCYSCMISWRTIFQQGCNCSHGDAQFLIAFVGIRVNFH